MVNESECIVHCKPSPQCARGRSLFYRLKGMLVLMACASLTLWLVGCGSRDDHGDHEEDEHLEHFVPAHKPADYSALVEQLERRIAQQPPFSDSGDGAAEANQSAEARQELIDIIGWIPELAADSELRKAEFEAAVSAGKQLNIALGFQKPAQSAEPFDQSEILKLLEELKALVPKSQTSTEPM